MIFTKPSTSDNPYRHAITSAYRMDETACVEHLLGKAEFTIEQQRQINSIAHDLVVEVRKQRHSKSGLDSFIYEYDLSTQEGITLMCLAEALLRIPDSENVDRLIKDKVVKADWEAHLGRSESVFVNAATWGLMLTGRIMSNKETRTKTLVNTFKKLVERTGEPVIRKATMQAMRILGRQFVMGRTMKEALNRARELEQRGYLYSYDMLGEAARTQKGAEEYYQDYQNAIAAIGKVAKATRVENNPGISVKLSALHPRYEYAKHESVMAQVVPWLLNLAQKAKAVNISLTIDAEEADRLDLSLDIIEAVFSDPSLNGWNGFGLAVQSYQKRAWYVLDWLADLAQRIGRRIMVRLIKGAYWDSEIKFSQERGLESYPVFTRKPATDVSFLACAKKILAHTDVFYPMFATHNAHSVAAILALTQADTEYEFQCLHGMGQALYDQIVAGKYNQKRQCRVYAPVGSHEDLLPYLVRRLLENGANSSFVNRIADDKQPVEDIITDPVAKIRSFNEIPHPKIPLPINIYGKDRLNSRGIDLTNIEHLSRLANEMEIALEQEWHVSATVSSAKKVKTEGRAVYDPSNRKRLVGWVTDAGDEEVEQSLAKAAAVAEQWDNVEIDERAQLLEQYADLLDQNRAELMALAIREAGKSIADAIAEVREAIDFCRYYALEARKTLSRQYFKGPTGEIDSMKCHGRGPVVCISPWNFPLAIFTGQVVAALVAGNPVLAKPAEQTTLIAAHAVSLMHKAGIPRDVVQLVPGPGSRVGAKLVADLRVKGVVFTGSTETARFINQTLAKRDGAIVPLIAETGGQNAMIVDSSALPEQTVMDVLQSAFYSAGQRCSALRVLYIQEEIADKFLFMLKGAMEKLKLGDPGLLNTDVGPVIDSDALAMLEAHAKKMDEEAKLIHKVTMSNECREGTFFQPRAYELKSIKQLQREVFGPILHVIRFKMKNLNQVIADINSTGYGLTLGIHSRIDETVDYIQRRVRVGNCYVNRNMVGAVVGVQPFGGEGLSGTGPKAGGPHYLTRLCTERSLSVNTTAAGGNASLMSLSQ